MILAFDTSSALTSVALVDGDEVVAERRHLDARRHAEVLAPLFAEIRDLLDPSDLEAVACGVGPGPYTGLRVGIATALAVGAAWQLPVHGVCSLDAIAAAALADGVDQSGGICVAADARRSEVYWARYDDDTTRIDGPRVSRPEDIDAGLRLGSWAGQGAWAHATSFGTVIGDDDPASGVGYPQASWVARCVQRLLAAGAVAATTDVALDAHGVEGDATARSLGGSALLLPRPLYLRRPDAAVPGGAA